MSLNWKVLVRSILIFLVSYYSLIAISYIPSVQESVHTRFGSRTTKVLGRVFPKAKFVSDPSLSGSNDYSRIKIIFANKRTAATAANLKSYNEDQAARDLKLGNLTLFIESIFVIPYVIFFALLLATPGIKLPRKALMLFIGYLLLSIFVFINITIKASFVFQKESLGIYELSGFWKGMVENLAPYMNTGVSITVAILVWILVAINRKQVQFLFTS